MVNCFCFLEAYWVYFKHLFMNFLPVNFYVSINCHMTGLCYFILSIIWGHLWWIVFIINLICLRNPHILWYGHIWVCLPWHFQRQFGPVGAEWSNESVSWWIHNLFYGTTGKCWETGSRAELEGVGMHEVYLELYFLLVSSPSISLLSNSLDIIIFYPSDHAQSHWNCKPQLNSLLSHFSQFTTGWSNIISWLPESLSVAHDVCITSKHWMLIPVFIMQLCLLFSF